MVDFSFIVSLYVSDLPNVTISTVEYSYSYEYSYRVRPRQASRQEEEIQEIQEIARKNRACTVLYRTSMYSYEYRTSTVYDCI